jgi:hypothetical protein
MNELSSHPTLFATYGLLIKNRENGRKREIGKNFVPCHVRETQFTLDMDRKPANPSKRLRVSYVISTVSIPRVYVSATLVTILREVFNKGYFTKASRTNA